MSLGNFSILGKIEHFEQYKTKANVEVCEILLKCSVSDYIKIKIQPSKVQDMSLTKGDIVFCRGYLRSFYQDIGGKKHYFTNLIAEDISRFKFPDSDRILPLETEDL